MESSIQEWIQMSEYDLKTAEAMLETGRYLYVAFMCQQVIEKILKAIYCQKKNELPPRTHNLLYLADVLELNITDSVKTLLSMLNQFYLETRYPGEHGRVAEELDEIKSRDYLDKTKDTWKCLRQKLL